MNKNKRTKRKEESNTLISIKQSFRNELIGINFSLCREILEKINKRLN